MMKKKRLSVRSVILLAVLIICGIAGIAVYRYVNGLLYEKQMLKQIVSRLEAESRIAEVLVTEERFNPITQKNQTTIKFLEYGTDGKPLEPKYFTFDGNLIQFQSLVVRFDDDFIEGADRLKGKSVYLFWKAFVLDGAKTQEYLISDVSEVPEGYRAAGPRNDFEDELWKRFWEYALDENKAVTRGIKNAQVEAPGMKFVPGLLYTLKIEHDGGIRIDAKEIPAVLRGEKIY